MTFSWDSDRSDDLARTWRGRSAGVFLQESEEPFGREVTLRELRKNRHMFAE